MEDKIVLEVPLVFKYIKDVIWSVAGRKSQGPYRFSMSFTKPTGILLNMTYMNVLMFFFRLAFPRLYVQSSFP